MSKLIEWKEPPTAYKTHWHEIAKELKANPGRWALVAENYGDNTCKALRRHGIKTRSERKTVEQPHRYDIYACYEDE